jgi:hypothetical protein
LVKHLKVCKVKKDNKQKEYIFKLLLEKNKHHQEEIKMHKVDESKKQNKLLMDKIDKLIKTNSN